jgi:hypothetical protein
MTTAFAALAVSGLVAGTAAADNGGRKLDLTTQAAIDAGDSFGALEDASGTITFKLNAGQGTLCIDAAFEGATIEALHLHEKIEGTQNGPVDVQLSGLLTDGGTAAEGCVSLDRADIVEIQSERAEYYINAHDADAGLNVIRAELKG